MSKKTRYTRTDALWSVPKLARIFRQNIPTSLVLLLIQRRWLTTPCLFRPVPSGSRVSIMDQTGKRKNGIRGEQLDAMTLLFLSTRQFWSIYKIKVGSKQERTQSVPLSFACHLRIKFSDRQKSQRNSATKQKQTIGYCERTFTTSSDPYRPTVTRGDYMETSMRENKILRPNGTFA